MDIKITFDPVKRQKTLVERGLDFADAVLVFQGKTIDREDTRFAYGETRIITVGYLYGRMMIIVWTARQQARHIISMRKANDREQKRYLTYSWE
jgi:uncharacterized protein